MLLLKNDFYKFVCIEDKGGRILTQLPSNFFMLQVYISRCDQPSRISFDITCPLNWRTDRRKYYRYDSQVLSINNGKQYEHYWIKYNYPNKTNSDILPWTFSVSIWVYSLFSFCFNKYPHNLDAYHISQCGRCGFV